MSEGKASVFGVQLVGTDAADRLIGTEDDDRIFGGAGDDILEGGAGDDLIEGGPGRNQIYGGAGSDMVNYASATRSVVVSLATKTGGGYLWYDLLDSIENVQGSPYDDDIFGDTGGNRLNGGAGDDRLWGEGGDDRLYGGFGDDNLKGGDGDDYLNGEEGVDTADYSWAKGGVTIDLRFVGPQDTKSAGMDTLVAIENVYGTPFDDILIGDDNANILNGDAGSNVIDGRGGTDTAYILSNIADTITIKARTDGAFVFTSKLESWTQTLKNVEIAYVLGRPVYLTFDFSIPIDTAFRSILRASSQNASQITAAVDVFNVNVTGASTATVVAEIIKAADKTTSVATLNYLFFTGSIPTESGYDYLISPTGPNANNLNSAYYQSFNLENRYINFAVNLGKVGDGKATFQAKYGSLSLFDATREAYKTIFGAAPTDAKIHALIDSRVDYFASYGGDGATGIGTKAAMVGWLLAEAEKADTGVMARANAAWLTDLADGSAPYAIDILNPANGYWKADFIFGG